MKLLQVAREMGRLESKIVCLQKENESLQRQVNELMRRTDAQFEIEEGMYAAHVTLRHVILSIDELLVRRGVLPPAMSDE